MKRWLLLLLFSIFTSSVMAQLKPEDVVLLKSTYEGKYVHTYYQSCSKALQFNTKGEQTDRSESGTWTECSLLHILDLAIVSNLLVLHTEHIYVNKDVTNNKLVQIRENEKRPYDIEFKLDKHSTLDGVQAVLKKVIRIQKDDLNSILTDTWQWSKIPKRVRISEAAIGPPLTLFYPPLPQSALTDHLKGPVVVSVRIETSGQITPVGIVHSVRKDLDDVAFEAAKQWKFRPYLMNGESVIVETQLTINFK